MGEPSHSVSAIADFFGNLISGTFVIGVAHEAQYDIFAAASVMLASRRPPLLAVSIDRRHAAYPLMRAGRVFSVSVLSKMPVRAAFRHSRVGLDLDSFAWHRSTGGAPIPDDGVLASFECEMDSMVCAGDHEVVLGRIVTRHLSAQTDRSLPRPAFPDRRRQPRPVAQGTAAS